MQTAPALCDHDGEPARSNRSRAARRAVYIVENEMVFSYLVAHLIKSGEEKQGEQKNTGEKILPYTLLCTSGQPRAAAQKLLPLLFKKRRIHLLQRRYRSGRNADCRPAVAEIRRRDSDLAYVPGGLSEEHFRRTHHRKMVW